MGHMDKYCIAHSACFRVTSRSIFSHETCETAHCQYERFKEGFLFEIYANILVMKNYSFVDGDGSGEGSVGGWGGMKELEIPK